MQNTRAATEAISERSARASRRQKRKDHPSAAFEPPVKAIKKQRQTRPAPKPRRTTKPPRKSFARSGLPYGESDSGEDCINVALPQYILDRIHAEGEEERVEAESKVSTDLLKEEPTQPGIADLAALQADATESPIDSAGEAHNPIEPNLEDESRSDKEAGKTEPSA